jgi:hypothetical protein
MGHGVKEQRLVHGQATTTSPHLGGTGVVGSAFQPALALEIQQRTPRRRSQSLSKARAGQAARGRARLGDERRTRWRMEVKQTDPHGQKREHEEADHLLHTATAETAGARRNWAATTSATHSRQRAREVRVRVRRGEREREVGSAGWARLVWPNPLGLVWPVGLGCQPVFFFYI